MDSTEDLIREHKRLVKVLKSGSKSELQKEARVQEKELKHLQKKYDYCPRCRKRKEHIKHSGMKMCKTCGYQEESNS